MSQPQLLWTVGFQEELDSPDDRLKCYGIGLSRKPGIWVFTIAGGGHIWKCSIDQEEIQEVGDELLAALEDDDEDIRIEIYTQQNDGQKKMRMIVCDLQIFFVVAELYTQAEIIMFKKRYQQAWDLTDQKPKLTFENLDDSIELELGSAGDRHENETGSKEKNDGGSQLTTGSNNEAKKGSGVIQSIVNGNLLIVDTECNRTFLIMVSEETWFTSWNPPGDTKLTEWIEAESIEYFTHGDKVKIGWDGDYITMDRVIEELTAIFEPEYAAEIVEFIETHPDDHPPVKISPHLIELLRVPQNPTADEAVYEQN